MATSILITQSIKKSYDSFVNRIMASSGLPFSEMTPLTEWAEYRYIDFNNSSSIVKIGGFEKWLSEKYN